MRKLVRTVRNAFRYGEAGFTLIELLVVIGILAALAGVVTLGVTQFIGRGEREACLTEVHNVQTAAAAYRIDTGGCPLNAAALVPTYLMTAPPKSEYTFDANSNCTAIRTIPCPSAP